MDSKTPAWGIEPVPERLRVLSFFDSLLLWGNLSVSLLVIVIGALLVPALSLRDALLAIVVGAIAGNVLLALAALIGADARVPGMVVLQFAVGDDAANPHLPQNHEEQSVVYTGTHDNDTTQGWFDSLSPEEQAWTELDPAHPAWSLIEVAWSSRAAVAIAPLQDVLGLGTEARMNLPGTEQGNWQWRFDTSALTAENAHALRALGRRNGRT